MQKGQAPFLVLIGILVIIAVAGGAYYLGRSQTPVVQIPQPTITPQPTPTPNASREPNGSAETANWKTYTDNKYFKIKYPPNWKLERGQSVVGAHIYNPESVKIFTGNGGSKIERATEYFDILSVEPSSKDAYRLVDEYKTAWSKLNTQIQSEDTSDNGVELVLYDAAGEGSYGRNIALSNGNLLVQINASIQNLGDKNIINQILSTFKFTP